MNAEKRVENTVPCGLDEHHSLTKTSPLERWALLRTAGVVSRQIVWFPITTYDGAIERLTRTPKLTPPKIDVEEMEAGTWARLREVWCWNWQDLNYHLEPTGYGWAALFRVMGYLVLKIAVPFIVLVAIIWGVKLVFTLVNGLFSVILTMLLWLALVLSVIGIGYYLWKDYPVLREKISKLRKRTIKNEDDVS